MPHFYDCESCADWREQYRRTATPVDRMIQHNSMCYRDPRMNCNAPNDDSEYSLEELRSMVRYLEGSELARMEKSTQTDFEIDPPMLIETILDGIVNILQASVVLLFDDLPSRPPTRVLPVIQSPSPAPIATTTIAVTDTTDYPISVDNDSSRILPPLPSDDEEEVCPDDLSDTMMLDYIRRQNPLLSSLLAVNSIDDEISPSPSTPSQNAIARDLQDWTDDFVAGV